VFECFQIELWIEGSSNTKITQEMVINYLESLRKKSIDENQISVAVRCLKLLGKHLAMFKDNSDKEPRVQVIVNAALAKTK